MRFISEGAGRVRATSPAGDKIEIVKDKRLWKLVIYEADTGAVMHTAEAGRQYECCQEACRYFGVGAFGDAA